jgi:hypothetical protein
MTTDLSRRDGWWRWTLGLLLAVAMLALVATPAQAASRGKGGVVKVMTRNLYLGANLTPSLNAPSADAFINTNGSSTAASGATAS